MLEYSNKYSCAARSLSQYDRDELALNNNNTALVVFVDNDTIDQTGYNSTKNVEIKVPLKYFSNVWRKIEMSLIICEIKLMLPLFANCVISFNALSAEATTFAITDARLYVPVVTLSNQDNEKLLQQLKLDFKRTIKWNKYRSKTLTQTQNQYLDYLVDPTFQWVNILFVISFENHANKSYILPTVEKKIEMLWPMGEAFLTNKLIMRQKQTKY